MHPIAVAVRRRRVAYVMLGLALTTSACARPSLVPTVPAQAPDSISSVLWDSLTAPVNIMTDPSGLRGRWARNVMFITFQRSASQTDRQAVIDLIHGEVLGGNIWPGGEGEYIVRIPYATTPGDSISGPVLRTFLVLRGHPSILTAYPLSMDNLSKIHQRRTTFDFELTAQAPGRLLPPDTVPHALFDSLGTVVTSIPGVEPGPYRRDIVVVRFEPETPLAARMAAIDSISGRIVGGDVDDDRQNGSYYVRISGGTFDALGDAVDILLRQPQVSNAFMWSLFVPDIQSYRRPDDGTWWKKTDWKIDPTVPDANRQNWALEYVRAPMAWGCDSGSAATSVAVADLGFAIPPNIDANVDRREVMRSATSAEHGAGTSPRPLRP